MKNMKDQPSSISDLYISNKSLLLIKIENDLIKSNNLVRKNTFYVKKSILRVDEKVNNKKH